MNRVPETWSDIAGLLSGTLLLVTALRRDRLSGLIDRMRAVVDEARTQGVADAKADKGLQSEPSRWSWIDRWSPRAGAVLLLTAFALKTVPGACNC